MSSSRWDAATPARSSPAPAMRTGPWKTRQGRASTPCDESATRSESGSNNSSLISTRPSLPNSPPQPRRTGEGDPALTEAFMSRDTVQPWVVRARGNADQRDRGHGRCARGGRQAGGRSSKSASRRWPTRSSSLACTRSSDGPRAPSCETARKRNCLIDSGMTSRGCSERRLSSSLRVRGARSRPTSVLTREALHTPGPAELVMKR